MRLCLVEGCNKKHHGNGYCVKHYKQIRDHGKILERTKYDLNEIIIEDQICRMKLYNIKNEEVAETIFDLKYKIEIEKYKWHLHKNGYVETIWYDENSEQHNISLHQAIIRMSGQEVSDGYEIDHKDNNPLNNLESNLRICSHSENGKNQKISTNNTSGYKSVSWHKPTKKWRAQIRGEHLGLFDDPKDAAKAYNDAAIEYHGEFAVLNKI